MVMNLSVFLIYNYVKLLKFELKKFYGNYIDWYLFWEFFELVVYWNSFLIGVDKFNYLKLLFGGFVVYVIVGLILINVNYEKVIDFLK